MAKGSKIIVGIDEVGRGPIAGPVAVCSLCICQNKNSEDKSKFAGANFRNFRDSKKLSHQQRLKWLEKINLEKEKGNIIYKVCFESNKIIDKKGLTFAIKKALSDSLEFLKINSNKCLVLLDGGLRAPLEYKNQKTIIRGDEKELAIALASIVAKVTRDELMVRLSKKYAGYGLEKHKGYGTRNHYNALKNKGISRIHRKSFLSKIIKPI
jgi:ribonuclease HII